MFKTIDLHDEIIAELRKVFESKKVWVPRDYMGYFNSLKFEHNISWDDYKNEIDNLVDNELLLEEPDANGFPRYRFSSQLIELLKK